MTSCKIFFIAISLLALSSPSRSSTMGCYTEPVNPVNCQTALNQVQYSGIGITAGETKVSFGVGNCLVDIESTGSGASFKADIQKALDDLSTFCRGNSLSGSGYNFQPAHFRLYVQQMSLEDPAFGTQVKLGAAACGVKRKDGSIEKRLIVPKDCVAAINRMKTNPPGSGIPLVQQGTPENPGLLSSRSGTCHVFVKAVNGLPITLGIAELQGMLTTLTNTCKQQNGRVVKTGGSFGKNSRIYLETAFN